jgi:hypothetical protein
MRIAEIISEARVEIGSQVSETIRRDRDTGWTIAVNPTKGEFQRLMKLDKYGAAGVIDKKNAFVVGVGETMSHGDLLMVATGTSATKYHLQLWPDLKKLVIELWFDGV